jgi:fatty-acyl-CoA synthase
MGLIACTLLPLWRGVPVRLIDTFVWLSNPSILMSLIAQYPRSYCWLPNFAFNYLAKRTRIDLSSDALTSARAFINCSEPCKQSDMLAFQARFGPCGLNDNALRICYAAAEYVFAITQTVYGAPITALVVDADILENERRVIEVIPETVRTKHILPVGLPMANTELRVGGEVVDGHVGEIQVRGPSMCDGYFRNGELTQKQFVDGWYHTGDLGFKYKGMLYITGRIDDLIIVRGKNIYAHDIEAAASNVRGVKEGRTTAFGVDDPSGTQQLIVVAEPTGEVLAKDLKLEISDRLNDAFGIVPAEVAIVQPNSLAKTTSGKISRSANLKNYIANSLDFVR